MQEEENKKGPMVDIDTSGPGADVELEETKPEGYVETVETKEEDTFKFIGLTTFEVETDDMKLFAKVLNLLKEKNIKIS